MTVDTSPTDLQEDLPVIYNGTLAKAVTMYNLSAIDLREVLPLIYSGQSGLQRH